MGTGYTADKIWHSHVFARRTTFDLFFGGLVCFLFRWATYIADNSPRPLVQTGFFSTFTVWSTLDPMPPKSSYEIHLQVNKPKPGVHGAQVPQCQSPWPLQT